MGTNLWEANIKGIQDQPQADFIGNSKTTELLLKAAEILKRGGLVAYPTDTVYGLGADALNEEAILRVFEVKKRPKNQPLPILVSDIEQLRKLVKELTPQALSLAHRFLPGGLTIVLYKAEAVSPLITSGTSKVAVRIPNHPIPLTLIRLLGRPLIGTSANLSSYPPPITAEEVRMQLGDSIDLIIPGQCPGGKPSTVIDLTEKPPKIIREGIISLYKIREVLGGDVQSADKGGD